jgi:hypothetical protein
VDRPGGFIAVCMAEVHSLRSDCLGRDTLSLRYPDQCLFVELHDGR